MPTVVHRHLAGQGSQAAREILGPRRRSHTSYPSVSGNWLFRSVAANKHMEVHEKRHAAPRPAAWQANFFLPTGRSRPPRRPEPTPPCRSLPPRSALPYLSLSSPDDLTFLRRRRRRRLGERRPPSPGLRRQRELSSARPFSSLRAVRNGAPRTLA